MKCPTYGCQGTLTYEEVRTVPVDMEIGEIDLYDPAPPDVSIVCEYCGNVTIHFDIDQDGPIIRLSRKPRRILSI